MAKKDILNINFDMNWCLFTWINIIHEQYFHQKITRKWVNDWRKKLIHDQVLGIDNSNTKAIVIIGSTCTSKVEKMSLKKKWFFLNREMWNVLIICKRFLMFYFLYLLLRRAFSSLGLFATKIRSSLGDKSINALTIVREHYKNK